MLQGGGSLGAFGSGVFKSLAKKDIKLDIIAGTSIGGVNAAIIAGSKDDKHPEKILEQFWLELAESSKALDSFSPSLSSSLSFIKWLDPVERFCFSTPQDRSPSSQPPANNTNNKKLKIKSILSAYGSAVYGNDKFFKPRWKPEYALSDPDYSTPAKWTYLYDHSPLVNTLEKYIDYTKLQPNGQSKTRLIMTAVNVLTAQPLTFDSYKQQITPKHILATCGYPVYAFPWVQLENRVYAWDGGLLSNTPLREVIDASPVKDKQVFLVENYPKNIEKLPENLLQVYHRARDIMFSDKTELNIALSKVISVYLRYIDEMYQFIEEFVDMNKVDKKRFENIRLKYKRYKKERGAEIKNIWYITRDEPFPFVYENADFSLEAIKSSIKDGELKTNRILQAISF